MHIYKIYNQIIGSEFDLSPLGIIELKTSDTKLLPSITISKSTAAVSKNKFKDNQTAVDEKYGYYFKENTALFEFYKGYEIKVSMLTTNHDADFIRILLNYPMACIFYQQGFFLLHASSVKFQNKVYLFVGSTLSGKSTIAAYLTKNGGLLITEDTAVIKLTNKEAIIYPSYPLIKISEEANKFINLNSSNGIVFPSDRNSRRGYLLSKQAFSQNSFKVDICIFPKWNEKENSIKKSTFSHSLIELLNASLSIYPLNTEKEKKLFVDNTKFLRSVKAKTYTRKKAFSSLSFLKETLHDNQGNST